MIGIVGYGVYVPKFRLPLEEVANTWKKQTEEMRRGLQVEQKAVPAADEDSVTLAVEAGFRALQHAGISPKEIGSIYIGSESHPYAVNPTSTIVADVLGMGNNYFAADLEFACKAGTAGVQITMGLLSAGKISYGLAIGSDTAQSRPHDVLEYTAGCGAVCLVVGDGEKEVIAEIIDTSSYSSNTPDFWRRDGVRYPSHFGRFTGEPAYFAHVLAESQVLLEKNKLTPQDFAYCVFHMPNGKFPRTVAKKLGFTKEQLAPSLVVEKIGNPYSASSLIGLAAVLDIAKPGQKIFFASYGSGAGSDGFIFQVTKNIEKYHKRVKEKVADHIADSAPINYLEYMRQTHKLT